MKLRIILSTLCLVSVCLNVFAAGPSSRQRSRSNKQATATAPSLSNSAAAQRPYAPANVSFTGDRPNRGGAARPGFAPDANWTRPNRPTRPDRPQTRPWPTDNRPNVAVDRPTTVINRPNVGVTRPDVNVNRPDVNINRPNVNINRPNVNINRPNVNINRQNVIVNRPNTVINRPTTIVDRPIINRPQVNNIVNNVTNVNNISNNQQTIINNNYNNNYGGEMNVGSARPWYGGYDNLHHHWHTGYWNLAYRPSMWVAGNTGVSWATPFGGSYGFSNPYLTANSTVMLSGCDYSNPIRPAYADSSQVSGRVTEEAIRRLDAARLAFQQQSYRRSLELVDSAIQLMPDDPVLHEFRSWVMFALGDYHSASAVIYPVLASGPGSDWNSMSVLYGDSQVYLAQLTNLTQFVQRNPEDVAARFLLGYHLLVVGYPEAAYGQLTEVLRRQPNDSVSRELIRALANQPQTASAAPY